MKSVRILVDDGKPHPPHKYDDLIYALTYALTEYVRLRGIDRLAESRIGFKHTPQSIARMSEIKRKRDAEQRQ